MSVRYCHAPLSFAVAIEHPGYRGGWTASSRLSHGELAASGPAGQLSQDRALLAASYLGEAAG